jgi:hypothetical protein
MYFDCNRLLLLRKTTLLENFVALNTVLRRLKLEIRSSLAANSDSYILMSLHVQTLTYLP